MAVALHSAIVKALDPGLLYAEVTEVGYQIALERSAALISGLSKTKKAVVRRLIARGLDEGWSDAVLRARLLPVIDLDQRGANAVLAYRAGLLQGGMAPGRVERLANAYAKRLLKARVKRIAEHEVRYVLREAQRRVWEEQQKHADVSPYAVRITRNHGNNPCPICRKENGRRRSLKDTRQGPPFHPNCRCDEELVDAGIEKHFPGLHDQKTHGHRGPHGMRESLVNHLQKLLDTHPDPVVQGYAHGLLLMSQKYPETARGIRGVHIDLPSDMPPEYAHAGAVTSQKTWGVEIAISPENTRKMYADYVAKLKVNPEERPWSIPDVGLRDDTLYPLVEGDPTDFNLARYGEAVALHEFGHLAHWHYTAVQESYALGRESLNAHMLTYEARHQGYHTEELKPVTRYAQTNYAEQFAEWFVADYYGMVKDGFVPEEWKAKVKKSLNATIDWKAHTIEVSKAVRRVLTGHTDYHGSIVEASLWRKRP